MESPRHPPQPRRRAQDAARSHRDNLERRQRFLQEAQAASALSHPNIITVFDILEEEGSDFIVMEYIAGKTLDALIPRSGMRVTEALRIAVHVADGLCAAHHAGIIHRDLKPGNVMVSDGGVVKILDFGLAKTEERAPGGEDDATRTVAPKTADGRATGEPRRLSTVTQNIQDIAWTPDSAAIVLSAGALAAVPTLWRASASTPGPPTLLPFGHDGASSVAIARTGNRLAYSNGISTANLWRLPLSSPDTPAGEPTKIFPSTRIDFNPMYSPDGKRVAFESSRSGKPGVWIGNADGSNVAEFYIPEHGHSGSPSWSPDGLTLAFDWNDGGPWKVYTMRLGGGKPALLTTDIDGAIPRWSRDGKWIYFTTKGNIWKKPSSGGASVQVTHNGGEACRESPDGKYLYYLKVRPSDLWRLPLAGGEEEDMGFAVAARSFALGAQGIYYIHRARRAGLTLFYKPYEGGSEKAVATLPRANRLGLSVSPDGRSLIYGMTERDGQTLVLVENFR